MALTVDQGFQVFLRRLVPLQSQRDAAVQHRASVENCLKNALNVGWFRETGSFAHGTGVRDHTDVDLFVCFSSSRPGSSDTALNWVQDALKGRFPNTWIHRSRPAVVIEFAGGDEAWEVIPAFLTNRGDTGVYVYDIPGPSTGWIDSAPREHLNYVTEINQVEKIQGGAKKLARLAKAWKYYNNVPISSFYLEMRAAQYLKDEPSFVPVYDICRLLESLEGHGLASMNDPKRAAGRFSACSSEPNKNEALSKLNRGAKRARKALDAYRDGKTDDAFLYLDLLFGDRFPAR